MTMATATPQAMEDDLQLTPDTVAERLRADDTRAPALQALEALPPPVPRELAMAAAPALVDVGAGTEDREVFDRCWLVLARMVAEDAPGVAVYGAGFVGERQLRAASSRLLVEAAQRALGTGGGEDGPQPLTRDDVYSLACWLAYSPPSCVRGVTATGVAIGITVTELFRQVTELSFLRSSNSSPSSPWVAVLAHAS